METHEYRIKCQACGLHYTVYSWDESWAGGPEEGRQGGWCPECGAKGGKMVWSVTTDKAIFEMVPGIIGTKEIDGQTVGESPPLMMTAPMKGGPFGYGTKTPDARGPYGTNEGDVWLSTGSDVQDRLDANGEGFILVHEMIKKDGYVQEVIYTTNEPEMVSKAQQGHERYTAQKASEN